MAFGDSTRRPSDTQTSTQPQEQIYLRLSEHLRNGERIIRILDQEEYIYWRYYMPVKVGDKIQDRSIVVGPGDTPIRKFMQQIGPDDRRFRKVGKRMLLNVLDRTPVKKTSSGKAVYAEDNVAFPPVDPDSGENLSDKIAEPHNKVLILDFGADLMKQFTTFHNRVRNQKTFQPMAIWEFDLQIVSIPGKEAKDVTRTTLPGDNQDPLPDDLKALLKYDLTKVLHPMPNEMQERLLAGDDLLEILKELNWPRPVPTLSQ